MFCDYYHGLLGGWIRPIEFAPVTSEPTLSQPGSSAARMVMLADYFVMGLYSPVSPHSSIPPPSAPSCTRADSRYPLSMETFDLEQTSRLAALASTPPEQRDDAWCASVLSAAPNASLMALDPQIQEGPDTFPYFQLAIPDPGAFTPFSMVNVLNHMLEAGSGAVIHVNPRRDQPPLWVFSLGDLLAYSLFQDFNGDPHVYSDTTPPDPNDRQVLKASPSESYFPATARAAMGRFMRGPFTHPSPKIGLVTSGSLKPRQNLMVN